MKTYGTGAVRLLYIYSRSYRWRCAGASPHPPEWQTASANRQGPSAREAAAAWEDAAGTAGRPVAGVNRFRVAAAEEIESV